MPVYQAGIPTGIVPLDSDYLNIQGNFQQANIVYGTDHYPFDNSTPNQGFHNQVTTPIYIAPPGPAPTVPPVTTTNPIFYAFQQFPTIGVLQYSRGPTNAIPTPLTNLYSSATATMIANNATTDVLDCTGFSIFMASLYVYDTVILANRNFATIFFNGTDFVIDNLDRSSGLIATFGGLMGKTLRILNNSGVALNNVYWTLNLQRVQ